MSKKMKILLAIVAAVVVLTVGGGVAVLAAGETTTPTTTTATTPSNPLYAKVAAILGNNITEQKLVDAFKQAREQVDNEAIKTWLAKALENKTITAEEKAAIEKWYAQKPTTTDKDAMKKWLEAQPKIAKPGLLNEILRAPGKTKQLILGIDEDVVMGKVAAILGNNITVQKLIDAFKKAEIDLKNETFFKMLDKAVTDGKITSDEAQQSKSGWGQKPAALDKVMPGFGIGKPEQGRMGMMQGRVGCGMMRFPQRLPGAMAR
jgi:uncharacterized protein YehS (DUF1456 family)